MSVAKKENIKSKPFFPGKERKTYSDNKKIVEGQQKMIPNSVNTGNYFTENNDNIWYEYSIIGYSRKYYICPFSSDRRWQPYISRNDNYIYLPYPKGTKLEDNETGYFVLTNFIRKDNSGNIFQLTLPERIGKDGIPYFTDGNKNMYDPDDYYSFIGDNMGKERDNTNSIISEINGKTWCIHKKINQKQEEEEMRKNQSSRGAGFVSDFNGIVGLF